MRSFQCRRSKVFIALSWALAALLAGRGAECHAHPVPMARANIAVDPGNAYTITLVCDVAALVMQATPGHLGDPLSEELREMPDGDLQLRLDEARKAFEQQFHMTADGKAILTRQIEFPNPATIRRGAQAHATRQPPQIEISGELPTGAKAFTVRFPEDVGKVLLGVSIASEVPQRQTLNAGETSRALSLTGIPLEDPTPKAEEPKGSSLRDLVTYALLGLLLAVVLLIFLRRARVRATDQTTERDGL